jgi:hypothetical protein
MAESSPNTSIVVLLKKYGTPIPIDFVASSLGRRTSEILEDVETLEKAGVVKREGESLKLIVQ